MPRMVDGEARRNEIAAAALAVARAHGGLDAVTFRSVADAMGASSTTVVTHYAPNRAALVGLLMNHIFALGEAVAEAALPALAPVQALRLVAETILPLTPDSRLLASIALDAGKEFGPGTGSGDEIAGWGNWLHERVRSLVVQIDPPAGIDPTTDALLGSLAGITLYGLLDADNWPTDRQHAALDTILAALNLTGGQSVRRTTSPEPD